MSNITVIRGGAIGDFVLTLPAIDALRRAFPERRLRLIGRPSILALARAESIIDHDDPRLLPLHREGPIPTITRQLFAPSDPVLAYAVDPEKRLELQLRKIVTGPILFCDPRPPAKPQHHIIDHLLTPLRHWDLSTSQGKPRIALDPEDHSYAETFESAPQVIIHPGSGSPDKCWPESNFHTLAKTLKERNWNAAILSGPVEIERGFAPDPGIEVRPPSLRALAGLLANAQLFIGNDSGPGHIAAAVGTPTISLFGPTDPRIWAPRGSNSQVLKTQTKHIADISISTVIDTTLQFLERNRDG